MTMKIAVLAVLHLLWMANSVPAQDFGTLDTPRAVVEQAFAAMQQQR